jgi:hypothetical protein
VAAVCGMSGVRGMPVGVGIRDRRLSGVEVDERRGGGRAEWTWMRYEASPRRSDDKRTESAA